MTARRGSARSAAQLDARASRERDEIEALLRAGQWELAQARAERAVAARPEDAAAHSLLSRALFYGGQPLRAVQSAERACELAPRDATLLARLGGLYVAVGRLDDAIARCRAALEIAPEDPSARVNLALALARTGAESAALDALASLESARVLPETARRAALSLLDELASAPRARSLRPSIEAATVDDSGPAPAVLASARRGPAPIDSVLAKVGRDLCALARLGRIERATGREAELDAMMDVLCRRRKSNPCLVGPAGVGKTAIVELLAHRIVEGSVPSALRGARVIEVSMASLTAGTSLRGELEARLLRLLEELRDERGVLLFLDEVHTLVAASASQGQLGVAEMLKPAMARGELSLIGATTDEGFERSIQRDPALARRFERIIVREPQGAALRAILTTAAEDLARHHGVALEPGAVALVESLAQTWLAHRRMPDIGVDLLDRALARAARAQRRALDRETLMQAAASLAHSSVAQLTASAPTLLAQSERALREALVGQRSAIAELAEAFALQALRSPEDGRPRVVLWLIGPPSVGKRTAARALARAHERPLVEFDLSSLAERHDLSKLTGASAGYAGYDDGAPLIRALRAQPNAVLCFDQPELAHPDARAVLAAALRDGALVDARGDSADLRGACVVFVSSTLDAERAGFALGAARGDDARIGEAMLGRALSLEIGATVRFEPLDVEARRSLTARFIERARSSLEREGVGVDVDRAVIELLSERPAGARALRARCERALFAPALRRGRPSIVRASEGRLTWSDP